MKRIVVKHTYRDKYYVPLMWLTPLLALIDGILEFILIPTPYRSAIMHDHLYRLVKQQMNKRGKEYDKGKRIKL